MAGQAAARSSLLLTPLLEPRRLRAGRASMPAACSCYEAAAWQDSCAMRRQGNALTPSWPLSRPAAQRDAAQAAGHGRGRGRGPC